MSTPSFKVATPKKPEVDSAKIAAFTAGADNAPAPATAAVDSGSATKGVVQDWTQLDNKKRNPSFTMRWTAREAALLKYISETTPDSMHEFVLQATRKALNEKFGPVV